MNSGCSSDGTEACQQARPGVIKAVKLLLAGRLTIHPQPSAVRGAHDCSIAAEIGLHYCPRYDPIQLISVERENLLSGLKVDLRAIAMLL